MSGDIRKDFIIATIGKTPIKWLSSCVHKLNSPVTEMWNKPEKKKLI